MMVWQSEERNEWATDRHGARARVRLACDQLTVRSALPPHVNLPQWRYRMEMAYRERWRAEIAELQKILSRFDVTEECKWGKPCYTTHGKNVHIVQGFKEYCALGFFQGALLKDPKKLLVQLGQTRA